MSAILHQALMAAYPVTGGGGGGVDWANVRSLLHFDGANGSTTITDSRGLRSWSVSGTAAISNTQSRFGGSSLNPGTGFASAPDAADLEPGSSDFCVECFFYLTNNSAGGIFSKGADLDWQTFQLGISSGAITLSSSTSGGWHRNNSSYQSVGAVIINNWHHVVLCRKGITGAIFYNGNRLNSDWATFFNGITLRNTTDSLRVGYNPRTMTPLSGFVDEFRYVIGESVYDPANSTITPPASPFPDA